MFPFLRTPAEIQAMILKELPGQTRIALTNTCRELRHQFGNDRHVQAALDTRRTFERNLTHGDDFDIEGRQIPHLFGYYHGEEQQVEAIQCIERISFYPTPNNRPMTAEYPLWMQMMREAQSIPYPHILYIRNYPSLEDNFERLLFRGFLITSKLTFVHLDLRPNQEFTWLSSLLLSSPSTLETISLTGQSLGPSSDPSLVAPPPFINDSDASTIGTLQQATQVKTLLLRNFHMINPSKGMNLDTLISIDNEWNLLEMPQELKHLAILGDKAGHYDATSSVAIHRFYQLESLFCEWTDGQFYAAKDRLPPTIRHLAFYGVPKDSVLDLFNMLKGSNVLFIYVHVQKFPGWMKEMTAEEEERLQWMVLEAGRAWWNPFDTPQFTSLRRLRGHLKHEARWWRDYATDRIQETSEDDDDDDEFSD